MTPSRGGGTRWGVGWRECGAHTANERGRGGGGPCRTPAASLDPCLCTDPALPVLKSVMGWGSPAASPFTSADLGTGMTCPDQSRLLCTGSDEKVPRWGRISKYKAPLRWRQGARDPCAQRLSGTFRWRRRGRWTSEGGALPGGWSQDGPQVSAARRVEPGRPPDTCERPS